MVFFQNDWNELEFNIPQLARLDTDEQPFHPELLSNV